MEIGNTTTPDPLYVMAQRRQEAHEGHLEQLAEADKQSSDHEYSQRDQTLMNGLMQKMKVDVYA